MQYLIGALIGGIIVGVWAAKRNGYYRDLAELKRSQIKSQTNRFDRLEELSTRQVEAMEKANDIAMARLKVEAEAAGVAQEFATQLFVRLPKAVNIERDCMTCKHMMKAVYEPPCDVCNRDIFDKWEPCEDDK